MMYRLAELVRRVDPKLHKHLAQMGIEFKTFSFKWMNNMLMRELSLKCILRLFDAYVVRVVTRSLTPMCFRQPLVMLRAWLHCHVHQLPQPPALLSHETAKDTTLLGAVDNLTVLLSSSHACLFPACLCAHHRRRTGASRASTSASAPHSLRSGRRGSVACRASRTPS